MKFLNTHTYIYKIVLFFGSILFLVISIFLSLGSITEKKFEEGNTNMAIVLDVSQSMNVRDMSGESRLQFAKNQIFEILSHYYGYNFALNIFAGESQRILPFSTDIELFSTFLQGLDSNNITKQGTRIDLAIQDALASFGENRTGILIIMTDGAEEEIYISPDIIRELKKQKIQSYIFGVGTKKGGYIPTEDIFQPYKIYNGERVVAKINTSELQKLAINLGGKYIQDIAKISGENIQGTHKNIGFILYLYFACIFWFSFFAIVLYEIYRK